MSNGASIASLSASAGGAPILLDDTSVPGKVIHANAADSGVIARVVDVLVGNPNAHQISLGVATVGPQAPAPSDFESMVRIDVPPTAEGTEVRLFYTPFVLEAGYSYYISTKLNPGDSPPYLYGYVEEFVSQGVLGYGGLLQAAGTATFDVPLGTWVTVPFDGVQATNPINVVQDATNNRVQINAPGMWYATIYVAFECKKLNSDRILNARFFDETAGAPLTSNPFPASVENGANNGSLWPTVLYEVPPALVGHWFRLELGGSSALFEDVEVKKAGAAFVRISPVI